MLAKIKLISSLSYLFFFSVVSFGATLNYAYVANRLSNNITIYHQNTDTGDLSIIKTIGTCKGPTQLLTDVSQKTLLVLCNYDEKILSYNINSQGDLKQIDSIKTGMNPKQMALTHNPSSNNYLYVANYSDKSVSEYVLTNGKFKSIGHLAFDFPTSITIDPNKQQYVYIMSNNVNLYSINSKDGLLKAQNTYINSDYPLALIFAPAGVPNVASLNFNSYGSIFTYHFLADTGHLDLISFNNSIAQFAFNNSGSAAFDSKGKFLYVPQIDGYNQKNMVQTYQMIDSQLFNIGSEPILINAAATSTTLDPTGKYIYITEGYNNLQQKYINTIAKFTIDRDTGKLLEDTNHISTKGTLPSSLVFVSM